MGPLVSHVQKEVCIFWDPVLAVISHMGKARSCAAGLVLKALPFAVAPMLTDLWQHEGCLW